MKFIDVKNPFDGSVIGKAPISSVADVELALKKARILFDDKKQQLPAYKRVAILEKAMSIMSENVQELTKLCASEGGKPWMDSEVEIYRGINGVKLAIEALSKLEGKQIAMGHTESSANRMAYTFKEPIGVCVSISAFNHPFNLAIHQIIPAVAMGCPIIIKPATSTPLSALKIIEILREAGLGDSWAQALVCEREASEKLAFSSKIDYLSFIGSAKVGWYLNANVADGVRVSLEHGGVAPVIVAEDADIDALIPSIGKGGFYHAGQVCVSVQRVYVHSSICKEVSQRLAQYATSLKVGNQLENTTEVGPLINHKEIERVSEWVNEAKESGGEIMCGGKILSESCYAPTVILNPSDSALVSTKEVFAPVVCIYTYEDIDEAIDRANALPVSFQAAVFTKNIDIALKATKTLNAKAVMINDHTAFRVDWMPFGGAKESGLGVGGIGYSMQEMTNEKLMVIKSSAL